MQVPLGKCSGWVIDLVIDHIVGISKYNPSAGSSYKITERISPSKKKID